MPNAFLSYSRASEGSVHKICKDLTDCGIDEVWWDKRLVGAQSWWDTILGQIRAADVVVCLIDEGMPESTAVRREYQYAIDLGKPLLPVLLSDHVEISTLPIQLAGKQYVDYRPACPDPVAGLSVAVRNLPPAPPLPNPLPPEPPIPISERDYLIEKINSTEPLEYDVQVDVLSRLRRLERSAESAPREFAQTSLKRLRNRPELLASVADDIDAVDRLKVPEKPRARGPKRDPNRGLKTAAVVVCGATILLLVAGYLYYRLSGTPINSNEIDSVATLVADADRPGSVDTDAIDVSSDKLDLNDADAGGTDAESQSSSETPVTDEGAEDVVQAPVDNSPETPADEAVEPSAVELAGPDADNNLEPVATANQEPARLPLAESADSQQLVSLDADGTTTASSDETSSTVVTAVSNSDALSKPVSASDTQADVKALVGSGIKASAEKDGDKNSATNDLATEAGAIMPDVSIIKDWDVDFTVFAQTPFDLCGFEQFTAVTNARGEGNMIEVRSKDRSIPDQPFRGLHVQVPSGQLFEILPGCRILLNYEVTSGVSRIRVRAKGAR